EFRQDADMDGEFFETAMSILEDAGYEHYEISNYARSGFSSVHNRAYWLGKDYLGIGPSAVSTVGMRRWQNVCDYRSYIESAVAGIATNATQTGAAAPFGPIDLADCDFHQPRRRGQRADCHERYCRCLPQGRLDFVRHQNSQAKADGCAGHDEERIKRKLFG